MKAGPFFSRFTYMWKTWQELRKMKNPEKPLTPAQQRQQTLIAATDLLSRRVGTLADAVQINNSAIDILRKEVNQKPDDVELKLLTGLGSVERQRHLKWSVVTSIIAATLAGAVAYSTAQFQGHQRCQVNAQNINTLVSILESTPQLREAYKVQIDDLKSNRNTC